MIIEIEGCKFRIKGTGADWQVQYPSKTRDDGKGDGWSGKYFFPTLDTAIAKAYELALRDSQAKTDLKGAVKECKRVKEQLVNAVKKAIVDA